MQNKKKICVLGAGNLGPAMAAHMALNGFDVTLGNRTVSKLSPIIDNNNQIELVGPVQQGVAHLTYVGGLKDSVRNDRDVIVICLPATGHVQVIQEIAPVLKPTHHVVLHPGQLYGALVVRKTIAAIDASLAESIAISEFESSLLTSRAPVMGKAEVLAIKKNLGFATLPATRTEEARQMFAPLYPQYLIPKSNVLSTGLTDLNAIVHPIVTLLNAGQIDRHDPFEYYHQGVTPAISDLVERTDAERMALCDALGLKDVVGINQWVRDEYGADGAKGDTFYELISTNHGHDGIMAPKDLYSRYFFEDIPTGVIPMIELAEKLNVKTPSLCAVYGMCKALFNRDWKDQARTLESAGLARLTHEQILSLVNLGHV